MSGPIICLQGRAILFPIDPAALPLLAMIGFALVTGISFAFAFNLRGHKWLFALPAIVAVTAFGCLCLITQWDQEYAGVFPLLVGGCLGAILIGMFHWVGFAHFAFRRMGVGGLPHILIVASLPGLIAASCVIWDQTLPRNDCAKSHLDVSIVGGGQYRVYPEFRVRFDRIKANGTGLEFQARYSSRLGEKRTLARLCRQGDQIKTARFWISPSARADAIISSCETPERTFCSEVKPDVMRQLQTVKIGRYDRSEISYYLRWFSREGDSSILASGDPQEGALCQSVGTKHQRCTIWRSFGSNQLGIVQTIEGANGLSPEGMIALANEGLDQMLRAFAPPKR